MKVIHKLKIISNQQIKYSNLTNYWIFQHHNIMTVPLKSISDFSLKVNYVYSIKKISPSWRMTLDP
jgi:hypothetical protein